MKKSRYFVEDEEELQRRNDLLGTSSRFEEIQRRGASGPIDLSRLPDPEQTYDEQEVEEQEQRRQPSRFQQGIDEGRQQLTDAAKDYVGDKVKDAARRAAGKVVKKAGQQAVKKVAGQAISKAATTALAAAAEAALPYLGIILAVIGVIIVIIILIVAIVSFSSGGDIQASGTSTTQSFDSSSAVDVSALRLAIAGGIANADKAKALLAETAKLRPLLSSNAPAIAALDKIDAAAQAIIDNPDNAERIKTEAAKIKTGFTELEQALADGLPAEGTFWRQFYDEAVRLGGVPIPGQPGKVGTPVGELYNEFNLTSNTCSGGLSRVIARVQKSSGKYAADELVVPKDACIDLFRALTNPTSRWAARIIAGQAYTTDNKREIVGERFGDLIAANKVPKGALVYILTKPEKGQRGHVFMYNGTKDRYILRSGSGGEFWKNDLMPLTAYDDYEVIIVALDTGIWAR
jgi:hypothetical protein